MGQHGDYRDVNADDVTVRDLLDFDALMARLTDDERTTVNRKIAHAIQESDAAKELEDATTTIAEMEEAEDKLEADVAALEEQRVTLTDRIEALERELQKVQADREAKLTNAYAEGHAEGYARGREDAA